MDGIRVVGLGDQDMSDGMLCLQHPHRTNPGGGICPLCLHDKLRNLLSSSFPLRLRGSYASSSASSSSSPPSLPSLPENAVAAAATYRVSAVNHAASSSLSLSLSPRPLSSTAAGDLPSNKPNGPRRARVPFHLPRKKKTVANSSSSEIVLKRSKSAATPSTGTGTHYLEDKRGGFWSFLFLSSSKAHHPPKKMGNEHSFLSPSAAAVGRSDVVSKPKERALASSSLTKKTPFEISKVEDDNDSPSNQSENNINSASDSSLESKVSRSRSVGCGSRSFSGDFFERISTGFGDCALRRVESQREAKPRVSASSSSAMKEDRVRCGGIFRGFALTPSSHSSPHWVSSSSAEHVVHGTSRSWVWTFASPMRAFNKPPAHKGIAPRPVTNRNNTTPDLSAIPSLLAVRT